VRVKYYLLIALFITGTLAAEIYRTVEADGNTVFSDIESGSSEKMAIDIAPSYVAPNLNSHDVANEMELVQPADIAAMDYHLFIVSPSQNETFQNPENIRVEAALSPNLDMTRGDRLQFELDGKKQGSVQASNAIVLTEVERGSHILSVLIVDSAGQTVKKSKSILFHVHRQSVLH